MKTPGCQLREQFIPCPVVRQDNSLNSYMEMLAVKGLKIHPALYPATFKTNNGLQYSGVATKQTIKKHQVLVRVPENLVLSSVRALEETALQEVYEDKFYHGENSWQDRVLITYLLYLLQTKAQDNIWYQMLIRMSKDIDILCFWDEIELDRFKDKKVKYAAMQDLKCFQEQWADFQQCQSRHPILQNKQFTKSNYKWMYIHMVSRCFGCSLQFISMVPFCQFFNHHISDVSYTTEKINEVKDFKSQDGQLNEYDTSEQSDESQDYLDEGEFDYESLDNKTYNWQCKECLDLDPKEKKIIVDKVTNLLDNIYEKINWKDFSILFVGHLMEMCKVIQTEYLAGRQKYDKAIGQLTKLQNTIQQYKKQVILFFKAIKSQKFVYKISNNELIQEIQQPQPFINHPKFKPGSYKDFILKTGVRDNFAPDNQVYFCYGRRSNRVTLLHYGISLQGNKYDHLWLSVDIATPINSFPDVIAQMVGWGLSRKRKFKFKHCEFNLQILVYLRLTHWTYSKHTVQEIFYINDKHKEIKVLNQAKELLIDKMLIYEGNNDLKDPQASYHEYFIRVYHSQKIRILQKHIKLIEKVIKILQCLLEGVSFEQAIKDLNSTENYMLRKYFVFLKNK